jgi:hypothetical protein
MWFDRILEVIKTIMPLIMVIGTGLVVPGLLEWWNIHKVRCCYRSLLAYFNKFCRSLGNGINPCTFREVCFDKDSDIESLISNDQTTPAFTEAKGWLPTHSCQCKTALNAARTKAGLGSGKFYFSQHFINKNYGELLVVLTVSNNTANMQAFCRGDWMIPKNNKKSRLRRTKVKLFGYNYPDYSIMLV